MNYDEAGNQTAQIDALNRTNTFAYDNLGRRTKRTLPGGQAETFGYNLLGNVIRHTNFNSVVLTNQYDVLNRLTNRASVGGYQVAYGYSLTGQRTNMVDGSGTTAYGYDARDRLLTQTAPAGILNYSYDANGNVTSITSSTLNGTLVTYQYDPLNRLTNVVDGRLSGTQNTACRFDGLGNLQGCTYPNGVTNFYRYDSLSRLTNLTWKLNTTALADFSYMLMPGGTRTNLIETVNTTTYTNRWAYDPLYRLTNDVLLAVSGSGTNVYSYDAVGNRLSRAVTGFGSPFTAPTNQAFNFDQSDRLDNDGNAGSASTWFDANGNTTNYAGAFQYDVENRLTNANNGAVIVVYNGDGQRVKKITPTQTVLYLVDSRNPSGYAQVLEELVVSGSTTNLTCAYTYGLDLISQRQPGVVTNFYGYDGHGSVRFLLTLVGGISDTYVYDAYGKQLSASGSTLNNYRYTGEQFDADLGFYYLRARYLDPNIGRFQTIDTFEGTQQDPLSLHKYLYCHGNPVNGWDPSGHEYTLAGITLSTFWHTYWRAGLANVTANLVMSKLLNQRYSVTEGVWDFATGGLMGGGSLVVGSAAKALSAKIGMKVVANAVFNFGPPAVNAAISTGEWIVKKNVVQHEDVSVGEVMWVFGLTTTANYLLHQGGLISEQKRESARKILEGVEQLRNGTAPRGFGSFRHYWSGLNLQTRNALEKWAQAVETNADLGVYYVLIGDIFEGLVGEVAEGIGDEVGDN